MMKFLQRIAGTAASALADRLVLCAVAAIVATAPCAAPAQTAAQRVSPFAAPQPAPPRADVQESRFYGCWKHAGMRSIANQSTAYSTLCFRNDRTVHYSYVLPERDGDDLFDWLIRGDTLNIGDQNCRIVPGATGENMFLARCLYTGDWVRQCVRMNSESTGCPRD